MKHGRGKTTVFFGGTILTMSEVQGAEALVAEDGIIKCVGSLKKCRHYAEDVCGAGYGEYDLKGKTLLPGFIDIHSHMMMLGMGYRWIDVSPAAAKSIDEIVAILKKVADHLPPGVMVRGFGHNHRVLKEKRQPNADDLDRIATDRPVQLMHHSGHSNIVNHFFMKQAGITDKTPDPVGGTIERDANGRPTGVLYDSAADFLTGDKGVKILNHGPNIHMPEDGPTLQNIVKVGQDYFISHGITSCNDIQVTRQEMESYLTARDSGLLKIRVGLSIISTYLEEVMALGFNSTQFGEGQLFFGPLKLYSDGALNAGTAAMTKAYSDGVKNSGFLYHDKAEMIELIVRAHEYGLQCATHGNGDAGIENIIQGYEKAQAECPREDTRHRIEHFSMPTESQIERMGKLGAYGVPQPHWLYEKGDSFVAIYGQDRAENFCPYSWYKKYGLPLIISSDAPVADPNPMHGIYAAVSRKTVNGTVLGLQHKLSVQEALEAYTINAAKGIFMEDKMGSLEPGKYADFVIFDKNPLAVPEEDLVDMLPAETWIDGARVYSALEKGGA